MSVTLATGIVFQPPPGPILQTYNLSLPASSQSSTIPQTLNDAFGIRGNVFVDEQRAVPLQHHINADDARSCHWILYAISSIGEPKIPIGTIRLVSPPHLPHPKLGDNYEAPSAEIPAPDSKVMFSSPPPKYVVDRKTNFHDGIEPYIQLGRLCLLKQYRGRQKANLLIQAALEWAKQNKALAGGEREDGKEWKGLVCVHANKKAMNVWVRNGFVVDEGMGEWFQAGLPHVAMFLRLHVL